MTDESDHDWELKGGGSGPSGRKSVEGHALFQCRDCNLTAARRLTYRNESLNSIIKKPDVEQPCGGESA